MSRINSMEREALEQEKAELQAQIHSLREMLQQRLVRPSAFVTTTEELAPASPRLGSEIGNRVSSPSASPSPSAAAAAVYKPMVRPQSELEIEALEKELAQVNASCSALEKAIVKFVRMKKDGELQRLLGSPLPKNHHQSSTSALGTETSKQISETLHNNWSVVNATQHSSSSDHHYSQYMELSKQLAAQHKAIFDLRSSIDGVQRREDTAKREHEETRRILESQKQDADAKFVEQKALHDSILKSLSMLQGRK